MKPGRELDALIAEKVMGRTEAVSAYKRCEDLYATQEDPGVLNSKKLEAAYLMLKWESFDGGYRFFPNYSTDIAAAWQVVEKLKMTVSAPTAPYADGEYANSSKDEWNVECTRVYPAPSNWSDTVSSRGSSAPHAICLAALKAIDQSPQ